jgi:hypothetical protein
MMEPVKRSHKKKPQSSGVGESKPFIAQPGAFEPGGIDYASLTVDGKPIPEHLQGLVPYAATDQGRAEANAGKQPAMAQVLRDPIDKSVDHYRDDLSNDLPLEENHDPLRILMQRHTPAGHRGLFMSETKVSKEGMRRGVLDYEPVLAEIDGKRERVRAGSMFLASVPEGRAKQADKYYAAKAEEQQIAATEKVKEQRDQVLSEAGVARQNKRGGEKVDGFEIQDGGMVIGQLGHRF